MNFNRQNFVNGSFYLHDKFRDNEPFAAGKIGNCELMCIYNYFYFEQKQQPIQWSPTVIHETYYNTGVFPQTENARIEFVNEMVASLPFFDCLALWSLFDQNFEGRLIKKFSPQCELIDLQSLEPFYFGAPWSEYLKDKTVLVISPFEETIKEQYKKHKKIWKDSRVLPEFKLITLKHPYPPGIDKSSKYSSWLEMVTDFKEKISNTEYDVAIVGTGASSLPLVAHCKKEGKKAIHLGGGLQILFGIKGGRWDNNIGKYFYNDYWTRPLQTEIPEKYKNIEGGCYW